MDIESVKTRLIAYGSGLANDCISVINLMQAENARLQSVIDAANAQEPVDYERLLNGEWVKCSKTRYEVTSDPVRALYALPIPAQQSPAVAGHEQKPAYYVNVPAGNPDGAHQFLKPAEWERHFTRCLYEPLYRAPLLQSPRITEQDAREIALSAWRYWMNNCDRTVDNWIEDEGIDLTNKLNEAKHD